MLQLQSGADPGFSTGELNLYIHTHTLFVKQFQETRHAPTAGLRQWQGRHLFVMDFYSGVCRNLSMDVYGDVAVRIFTDTSYLQQKRFQPTTSRSLSPTGPFDLPSPILRCPCLAYITEETGQCFFH